MPTHPVLMVLYTNDAVEVRYSDGSQLHVLPCGSAFSHHVTQDSHPIHGMKVHHQRCRFATSDYKKLVLSALDFRNRFAERPYVCQDLIEPDQVVPLYAKIKQIAWPKVLTPSNCELLEDGGVRLISDDQFGSVVLSAHTQDFTVCYLSLLSEERKRETIKVKRLETDLSGNPTGNQSSDTGYSKNSVRDTGYSKNSVRDTGYSKNSVRDTGYSKNSVRDTNPTSDTKHVNNNNNDNTNSNNSYNIISKHKKSEGIHKNFKPGVVEPRDELTVSPITQTSYVESPQAISNVSGSPLTPQNVVKDDIAKYRPFSTPTRELDFDNEDEEEAPVCAYFDETAVSANAPQMVGGSLVTFESQVPTKDTSNKVITQVKQRSDTNAGYYGEVKMGMSPPDHCLRKGRSRSRLPHHHLSASDHSAEESRKAKHTSTGSGHCDNSGHSDSNDSGQSQQGISGSSEVRCLYSWVTRHISCNECPLSWSAVVKLATEVKDKELQPSDGNKSQEVKQVPGTSQLRRIKKDRCVFSPAPSPLPLSCPGQHLHKTFTKQQTYTDDKDPREDPSALHHGRLKIMLIDGVVYRIVRMTSMKVVEVYPGDGSVLVSQGMTGQYFLHRVPRGDKIEDRTYSLKSAVPVHTSASYSVIKLIKRAQRFLTYANQEEKMVPASTGFVCWKYCDIPLVEPVPATVLEDCTIPGYGKFSALSNGQIRIVFEDRTALDMTWDFSKRINNCLEHSTDNAAHFQSSRPAPDSKAGMCRLLLPRGQYQMVDITQPGIYKRYVEMACEWGDWVNSSPAQRGLFYKNRDDSHAQNVSVQRELQKISCFNYIVDNTLFKKPDSTQEPQFSKPQERKGILRNSDNTNRNNSSAMKSEKSVTGHQSIATGNQSSLVTNQNVPLPYLTSSVVTNRGYSSHTSLSSGYQTRDEHRPVTLGGSHYMDGPKSDGGLDFSAVREALLRTSSVINDIDSILDRRP